MVQIGPDRFTAGPLAAEWLHSGQVADLVRHLHLGLALLGETLDALADAHDSATLTRILSERYPDGRLTRKDVTARVALLVDTGLAERIGARTRRTPLGTALAGALPPPAAGHTPGGGDTGGAAARHGSRAARGRGRGRRRGRRGPPAVRARGGRGAPLPRRGRRAGRVVRRAVRGGPRRHPVAVAQDAAAHRRGGDGRYGRRREAAPAAGRSRDRPNRAGRPRLAPGCCRRRTART
ncbi:hypothetical protein LT493_42345 [Streptomyces tricolor]|nr:hypothetical protein [Streptomyces tricolor]